MQLKEEFRTYENLRREHDTQIVQIATEGEALTPNNIYLQNRRQYGTKFQCRRFGSGSDEAVLNKVLKISYR